MPFFSSRTLLWMGLAAVFCSWHQSASAQKPRRPANVLGNLFRDLDRGIRQGAEDLKNQKTARDQLDVRPVQRPEDNRRLQQATEMIEQGRWHDAVEVLQYLLDQPTDVFSIDDSRDFHSLQSKVDLLIAGLPPEGLRNYVNRYSVTAEKMLEKGTAEQDDALLIGVSTHYFHTPAGRAALRLLARNWQDQGEFGRAAEAWLRLLSGAEESEKAEVGDAAVRNLTRAGRITEALQLAETLPNGNDLRRVVEQRSESKISSESEVGPFLQFTGAQTSATDPEPSLLPRWSQNLIERFGVRHQIDILMADLKEQNRALIPTLQPLAVDGKLALRTLRSLQVRDLTTGKLLWERRMHHSPEELLTSSGDSDEFQNEQFRFSQESMVEHHPLTSLIYRDQVYGNLSSDGGRLFAVESTGEASMSAPVHAWQMHVEGPTAATPWETNELTAYDLQSGAIRWRIGGKEIEEEFSRPLAGTHFFSAPTPAGAELYVIGERKGEVSLFCLSAQTGEEIWTQPLASPGRPIKEDMIRGQWASQPVLADGVILCPTTCGWLTAIDRATHRLKWTSRYAPRLEQQQQFRGGYSVQPLQDLNRRWQAVITLVANGKVLITPPEMPDEFGMTQPMLYCLDLQTGKTLWEQPKAERSGGSGLYLAGIWNDQAVIVGTTSVIGRSLEKGGEILWSLVLPQRPSGRGIIVNSSMLLPVTGSTLLQIDLRTASIEKTLLPAVEEELGNLELHRGQLIATTYQSVVVLPADSQPLSPESDPELIARTKLREAKLLLANQQYDQLETMLAEVLQSESISADLRQEILDSQRAALMRVLGTNPPEADKILVQLQQLAQTPQQQRDYQRMRADHLRRSGDFKAALIVYLDLLDQYPIDERVTDGSREMRIDSWIGGRLRQLCEEQKDESNRVYFHEQVQLRLKLLKDEPVVKDRWARALAFDALGLELELELAESEFQKGSVAAGLLRLSRVADAGNASLRPEALKRLANRLAKQGWHQDALACWQELQQESSITLNGGRGKTDLVAAGIAAAREAISGQTMTEGLWDGPWTLERAGVSGNETSIDTIPTVGTGWQALSALHLEQEAEAARIRVEDRRSGEFLASFPLRSHPSLEHNPNVGSRRLNSLMLVMHRGVLHALAWPDRKMLWTWNSDVHGLALTRLALVQPNSNFSLQPVSQFTATRQFHANRNQTGYLLAASPRALLLHCKDWIALDPLTGEELWRDHSTSDRGMAQELGTDWLITSTRSGRSIRNVIDGQPRAVKEKNEPVSRTITVLDQDLIVLNRNVRKSIQNPVAELQRITPTGDISWKVEVPNDALLGLPDANSLIWLTPQQDLVLINLRSGQRIELGKIPTMPGGTRTAVSVLADEQRFYVFIDSGDSQPMYVNMPAIRFAGKILAFDRQGQLLWNYDTPYVTVPKTGDGKETAEKPAAESKPAERRWPLNVLVQEFSESPLLLLVGDLPVKKAELYYHQIRVLGLNKATGQPLVDWERPSESGGFSFLHVDAEQQAIELRTYNERLQLKLQSPLKTAPETPE